MAIRQLLLAKFLFKKGLDFLKEDDPMSCGVAVSLFQDSSEMLLRAIAKHVDANVSERDSYDQLWDRIKTAPNNGNGVPVPLRPQMTDINKARVNFKHYGNPPNPSNTITFGDYTDKFLRESIKLFFDIDYDAISLADLIQKTEIRDYVKEAEQLSRESKRDECLVACAKAEHVISASLNSIIPDFGQQTDISSFLRKYDDDRHLEGFIRDIFKNLNTLRLLGIASLLKVNITDFVRFYTLKPDVVTYGGGKWQAVLKKADPSDDDCRFCLNYVTDFALTVQYQRSEQGKGRFRKTLNDLASW